MDPRELLEMAWTNARKLQHQMAMVLDLASLESGSFHVRLREVDLGRVVDRVLVQGAASAKTAAVQVKRGGGQVLRGIPLLADPGRLARAVELLFGVVISAARSGFVIEASVGSHELQFKLELKPEVVKRWDEAWLIAAAGVESGVTSPLSAFGGVVQSEQAFLTRTEEGLGSELMLVKEIVKLHGADLTQKREGPTTTVRLVLPKHEDEEGLRAILASRAYHVSSELGSVGLILVEGPPGVPLEGLLEKLAAQLFRATDAVYGLSRRKQLALVLDECKPDAPPGMMTRLQKQLGMKLRWGAAHCPTDGLEPAALVDLAEERLNQSN